MKSFKVFLTSALVAAVGVWAQVWDGKIDSEWYWDNQQNTEFTISTAAQLAGLAQLVNGGNNFSGKTIKLTANIMLNDTAALQKWHEAYFKRSSNKVESPKNAWTPIGSYTDGNNSRPFAGIFDGGGKIISGVYINSSDHYKGLFGYIASGAIIKNLGIAASFVKGNSSIGNLVGWNSGTITDCYAIGNVEGKKITGGLVGGNDGTITNCYAMGNVIGEGIAGGLVGLNGSNNASKSTAITNSYATGNAEGGTIGGLVGRNTGGTLTNSYAMGNVKGSTVGGLVGYNEYSKQ